MTDKVLRFQKRFSKQNKVYLGKIFDCQDNETILFGFWKSFFSRKGFLFTEKKVYYNIHAEILIAEGNEKTGQDKGFITRDTETHVEIKTSVIDENLFISIKLSDRTLTFNLCKNYPEEKVEKIQKLFRNYFDSILFPEDTYCMEDNLFRKKIFNAKDSCIFICKSLVDKIKNLKINSGHKTVKTEKKDKKPVKNSLSPVANGIISFIQNFIDLIEDFFLIFVVLCRAYPLEGFSDRYFGILLTLYFVLKLLTTLISGKSATPVPVLILCAITLNALIIRVNFLIFLAEYLILYVAFQISCNHHAGTVITKTVLLLAGMFVIYVIFLCMINDRHFSAIEIFISGNPFASAIIQIFKAIKESFVENLLSHNQL